MTNWPRAAAKSRMEMTKSALPAGPVRVTVVGQEYAPVDVAVLIAGEHYAVGAPEIDVVVAVREAGVAAVFEPNSVERLASQSRNCRKMYLSEVLATTVARIPNGRVLERISAR